MAYDTVPAATSAPPNPPDSRGEGAAESARRHWSWAKLMRHAFDIDVLACLRCGGRLRLIAIVEDPREICEVLGALAHSAEPVDRAPPSRRSFAANPAPDVYA